MPFNTKNKSKCGFLSKIVIQNNFDIELQERHIEDLVIDSSTGNITGYRLVGYI